MRADQFEPRDDQTGRAASRREGIELLRFRLAQARQLKVTIAQLATKFRKTGVRTDSDVEVIGFAMFRLNQAIYMAHLLKQALIGL